MLRFRLSGLLHQLDSRLDEVEDQAKRQGGKALARDQLPEEMGATYASLAAIFGLRPKRAVAFSGRPLAAH